MYNNHKFTIFNYYVDLNGGGHRLRIPEGEARGGRQKGSFNSSYKYPSHDTFSESVENGFSPLFGERARLE